ncbi:MAG: FAD-binding oxidoreductase [Chloroflexota bacterium]
MIQYETLVNDIHSKCNETKVAQVVRVKTVQDVVRTIQVAKSTRQSVSIAGGRHAMGGQQFGTDTILLDMRQLNRITAFDKQCGQITVEAGIEWPALINGYLTMQTESDQQWGIAQKQTGADRLSIGGAIAANIHGRGLQMRPFIQDIVSLTLVDAEGNVVCCSRTENRELFRLVLGGYGLFGVVVSATIQLMPRQKVRRDVTMQTIDQVLTCFDDRIADGYLYGDFQFGTDAQADTFLNDGVMSCYRPVSKDMPILDSQQELSETDWANLLYLGHVDKSAAFAYYTSHYCQTSGQIYWSDTQQMSVYLDDYHTQLDQQMGVATPCSEIITELYVPRHSLVTFMELVRDLCRTRQIDVIYGTVRLIETDNESFLAWAREPYACVIFNLHTAQDTASLAKTGEDFRQLIDAAIAFGGSYYLTYHRFARRDQVLSCYPNMPDLLAEKLLYDPEERFQSNWYRHYKAMFL